jgi:hypothetical protein
MCMATARSINRSVVRSSSWASVEGRRPLGTYNTCSYRRPLANNAPGVHCRCCRLWINTSACPSCMPSPVYHTPPYRTSHIIAMQCHARHPACQYYHTPPRSWRGALALYRHYNTSHNRGILKGIKPNTRAPRAHANRWPWDFPPAL